MSALVITIHIIACVFLIILVLLQSGKEGMGVIFGGGSGSVFGGAGAGGLLVKLTTGAAIIFLITSLSYNKIISSRHMPAGSIMPETPAAAPAPEGQQPQGGAGFEVEVPMSSTQGGTQVQVPAPGSAPEGQAPAATPAPQPEPAKPEGEAKQ